MSISQQQIVDSARDWLGTPYRHQASLKHVGADCLGLLRGVWRELVGQEPRALPAYSPHWAEAQGGEQLRDAAAEFLVETAENALQPGAVLLFRFAPNLPAKHCGIYTGENTFVHAQERVGTVEVSFGPWWQKRLCNSFQFPNVSD